MHGYPNFHTRGDRKKPTNVSLSARLIEEAKRLRINLSQACESGLEQSVRRALAEEWLEQNQEALEAWNAYVERNGLPLARHRQF
jgi:antitoxin CcdA